jgi:hypothetical protein
MVDGGVLERLVLCLCLFCLLVLFSLAFGMASLSGGARRDGWMDGWVPTTYHNRDGREVTGGGLGLVLVYSLVFVSYLNRI